MYLAICILMVGMFLYVKQKLALMESKIHLLSETISTMAGITMTQSNFANESCQLHESYNESDESEESQDGSETSSETGSHELPELNDLPELNELPELVNEIKHIELDDVREEGIVEPIKIIVSDDDVNVKQIVVDTSYESMTVKELKEKISELNGPKLKTKKEMLDYLKNKI
jgi:hypothetical protein